MFLKNSCPLKPQNVTFFGKKERKRGRGKGKGEQTSDQISNPGGTVSSFAKTPGRYKAVPYRDFQVDKSPSKDLQAMPHRCLPLYNKESKNFKGIVLQ